MRSRSVANAAFHPPGPSQRAVSARACRTERTGTGGAAGSSEATKTSTWSERPWGGRGRSSRRDWERFHTSCWASAVKSNEVSRAGATLGVLLARATVGTGVGGPGSWPATTKRAGPDRHRPQSAGLPEPPWPHAEPSVAVANATRGLERWEALSCHIRFTVTLIFTASACDTGRNGGWPWQP